MSKKIALILIFIIVVILAAFGTWYLLSNKESSPETSNNLLLQQNSPTPSGSPTPTADLEYTDEAGFTFKYPEGFKLEDTTPDDEQYYSLVTLSKGEASLTISVLDTTYKTTSDWALSLSAGKPSLVGSTTLGKLKADQYIYRDDLVTIAIDKGVMYLIKGPNNTYWEEVQNVVTGSFAFAGQATTAPSNQGSSETSYEEEVVE